MKHSQKGFTLVELLVVIAILAILATVSVVGYTAFIQKANLSNDQATITMINKVLMAEEVFGKPENITEALDALRANGFSYEKQVPYSTGYHYGYHNVTNRYYLLDKSNNVCYPEGATVPTSELWLPYKNHATSIVAGVSMYYAVGMVDSQIQFDQAFTTGSFVLDLNGNVCTVNKGAAQVSIQNGIVTGDGFAIGSGVQSIVAGKAPAETTDAQGKVTKRVYTGTLNPGGLSDGRSETTYNEVEYIDCVFTDQVEIWHSTTLKGAQVTFTNCKFINIDSFAIVLQPGRNVDGVYTGPTSAEESSVVTIAGCEFINCNRGIHISDWEYTTVNITDCKFSLKTGETPYNCIQISNYDSDAELKTLKINFENNDIASANGVIYFHNDMKDPQDLASFKAIFGDFSSNTYSSKVAKIADRYEYTEGHVLYLAGQEGNAMNPTFKAELEALVK